MTRKRKAKKHKFSKKKIAYSIIAVIIIAAGVFLGFQLCTGNSIESNSTSQYRAAIVDQLGASMPNQTFVREATTMMEDANFTVDYYSSGAVTVDFYRNLPTYGYDLIVLRVHSAIGNGTGTSKFVLFSSEAYSKTKYQYEQLTNKVG
ncbi:hypothetical protein KA005_40960, partial [bacterium]|nr:hypothetical protein [bacterium]